MQKTKIYISATVNEQNSEVYIAVPTYNSFTKIREREKRILSGLGPKFFK